MFRTGGETENKCEGQDNVGKPLYNFFSPSLFTNRIKRMTSLYYHRQCRLITLQVKKKKFCHLNNYSQSCRINIYTCILIITIAEYTTDINSEHLSWRRVRFLNWNRSKIIRKDNTATGGITAKVIITNMKNDILKQFYLMRMK